LIARRLVAALVQRAPRSLIRAVGSRTGSHPLLARLDRLARVSLTQVTVIPRGAGEGLRYDTGGGRAGFALGTWEPELQRSLVELVGRGTVVWDVGAASGFHTLILARLVGEQGHVVAFEPFPENIARLRRNIELNGFDNVIVVEKALADSAGVGFLAPAAEDEVTIVLSRGTSRTDGTEVEVTTVDQLLADDELPRPHLLKIDVEGAEVDLLRGARRTIEQLKPVLVLEVHGVWEAIDDLLDEFGYDYVGVEHETPRDAPEATHIIARPRV
jgi:FkbM family methyltransferase